MPSLRLLATFASALLVTPWPLAAQSIGVFRWQLEPYCNVLTLKVEQEGTLYRLDGTDDLRGATRAAQATGLAVPNSDGTIGLGLTIVDAPSGLPIHVSAVITVDPLGGAWRDALGHGGAFTFTPGPPSAGLPRPPATTTSTAFEWQQAPGGAPRGIVARASVNGDPVNGDAAIYGQWGSPAISHTPGNAGVRGESANENGGTRHFRQRSRCLRIQRGPLWRLRLLVDRHRHPRHFLHGHRAVGAGRTRDRVHRAAD